LTKKQNAITKHATVNTAIPVRTISNGHKYKNK